MAPKLNPTDARQGEKTSYMPYVLGISLAAAVVILLVLLMTWS